MKTIAIFSGYHLPHLGGIERYTDNLSKELVKLGYKVIIISSDYQFDGNYKKEEKDIIYFKIPVHKLFVSRYPIPKKNKEFKQVINELDQFKIDRIIVNTRFHLTSLVGAKYGHKRKIPVFQIEHGSQHLTVDNKILDFFGSIYEHLLTSYLKRFVDLKYDKNEERFWFANDPLIADKDFDESYADMIEYLSLASEYCYCGGRIVNIEILCFEEKR